MPVKLPPDCVIKFTATWCGPCKAIAPFVDEICQKYSVPLVVVDVDEDEETSRRFKVKAMPTLVFLSDGAEVEALRVVGASRPNIEAGVVALSESLEEKKTNQIPLPLSSEAEVKSGNGRTNR